MRNDAASVPLYASVTSALSQIRSASPNSNDGIMMSYPHEREALSEAVLIRVS